MPWDNLNVRFSSVRITRPRATQLTVDSREQFEGDVRKNLGSQQKNRPAFPMHWSDSQRRKWSAALVGIEMIWQTVVQKGVNRDSVVLRVEWRRVEDTPSDGDWESYSTKTLPQVISKWESGTYFKGSEFEVQPEEVPAEADRRGFELVEKADASRRLAWIPRVDVRLPEIRRHPGNSLVLLIDEAASFLNPSEQGGGMPNLELFKAFVQDAPNLRVFFFTAGSDFSTDLNILSTIIQRVPPPAGQPQLNPFLNLGSISLPYFPRGKRLSFEEIREQAGELLDESGGFSAAALFKLRNASKGLLSVATATNRDYFAEVVNLEPADYVLPETHADELRTKISRVSPTNFALAIICIRPTDIPREALLSSNANYDPNVAWRVLVEDGLLPGARALLSQLRQNDIARPFRIKQAVYSTLREDSRVVDLYAAVMQAAGYRWIKAKKRSLDFGQWTVAQLKAYEMARADGTLAPELRSVYLDMEQPLERHAAYGRELGPLYLSHPHEFVVLSESLVVSDTDSLEPESYTALRDETASSGQTDTGFSFLSTMRELREAGLQLRLPADASEEMTAQLRDTFRNTLRQMKKLHLHLWPGRAYASRIQKAAVLQQYHNTAEPSFFILKRIDDAETVVRLDDFLSLAGLPGELNERFLALKLALRYKFTMSDYEQRDLLSAITERWNATNNAKGKRIRFLLYGGNYSQGFDLADTLTSIALHPSNRADEIQSRGRTNRRGGMPNIPFRQRIIHHSTLVAKWPGAPVTVSDVFPYDENQIGEEDEYRYGRMTEEQEVISRVYEVAAEARPSRPLNEDDPLQPYEVWRCKQETPSVTAFRQAGDTYMQDFALDKPFSMLIRDQSDEKNPDSEQPSSGWQYAPVQWSLKKDPLTAYWAELTQELDQQVEAQHELALRSGESDEEYNDRLIEEARRTFGDAFDRFDAAGRSVILDGLRNRFPQKLPDLSEPAMLTELRHRQQALYQLIEAFNGRSTVRLMRRLALDAKHRFLLLMIDNPVVIRPTIFALASDASTQLLEHLVRDGFAAWNPDIQQIKTDAELAAEGASDDGSSDLNEHVGSGIYIGTPMLLGAIPNQAEIAEAREFTKRVRPYSNALEALGILDDEQETIEEHDGRLAEVLYSLHLWRMDVHQLNERQQLDLLYNLNYTPALLKDAIIELSKFGMTNWRRALASIAGAIPNQAEIAEAREFTKRVRPYSNALEALGILDDEQETIEEHDGRLAEVLYSLHLWRMDVHQLNERQQLDLLYNLNYTPALLKDAIIELSKFGMTNWRRALASIAAVATSEALDGKQKLRFVAQLIGLLFYTVRQPGFESCLAWARGRLNSGTLNQILEYFRLLFQWSALYSPWDTPQLGTTFGLNLHSLLNLLTSFQDRFGLDLFLNANNMSAFKNALFLQDRRARVEPLLDTDRLAAIYARSKGVQLVPLLEQYRAQWDGYNLKRFYRTLADENASFEEARTAALRTKAPKGLAERYYRVSAVFLDGEPMHFPDPEKSWTTRQIVADVLGWALASEEALQQPLIGAIAKLERDGGLSYYELTTLLANQLVAKSSAAENRQLIWNLLERLSRINSTLLSLNDQIVFVDSEGVLLQLINDEFTPIAQKSLFEHYQDDPGAVVQRADAFVDDRFIQQLVDALGLGADNANTDVYFGGAFLQLLVGKRYDDVENLVNDARGVATLTGIPVSALLIMTPPHVRADPLTTYAVMSMLGTLQVFADSSTAMGRFVATSNLLQPLWDIKREIEPNRQFLTAMLQRLPAQISNPTTAARFQKLLSVGSSMGLSEDTITKTLAAGIASVLGPTLLSGESYTTRQLYTSMTNRIFATGRTRFVEKYMDIEEDLPRSVTPEPIPEEEQPQQEDIEEPPVKQEDPMDLDPMPAPLPAKTEPEVIDLTSQI